MPWISRARLAAIEAAERRLPELEALIADRATLVSIDRTGRTLRLIFQRGEQFYTIETYATIDANVEAWKRELLE